LMKEVKKLRKENKSRKAIQKAERQVKRELGKIKWKIKLKKKAKTWLTKMGQDKEAITKQIETLQEKKKVKTNDKKTLLEKKKVKKEEKNSLNWLYEDKTMYETQDTVEKKFSKTAMGKNIQELYGSKFGELTKAQQEYILDNQEIMRRITQQVLTRQARVSNLNGLNVNRSNIIEFYLHPNGDMSDFKFLEKSGYFILDEITRVTIQYAYSKYPRPKEKTLIRYNVFYNLKSY